MATTDLDVETSMTALATLEEMIERQREKVRALARRLRPGLTDDELRNVHALPEVHQDPTFQYEDGQLAGLLAAKFALEARLLDGTVPRA